MKAHVQQLFDRATLAHCAAIPLDKKRARLGLGKPILGRIPARDRVFTPELAVVSNQVLTHSGGEARLPPPEPTLDPAAFDALFDAATPPYPAEMVEALAHAFSETRPEWEVLDPVLDHILALTAAGSLAFLVLDIESYTFKPALHRGIDSMTLRNLRFSLDDVYLDPDLQEQTLTFRGNLSDDVHFRKRFSTSFFREHGAAVFLNLRHHTFPGYLVLFFAEPPGEEISPRLVDMLADILPAILRISEGEPAELFDLTEKQFGIYKEFTRNGKEPMDAIRIRFPTIMDHASGPLVMQQICDVLLRHIWLEERIVVSRVNELTILAAKGRPAGLAAAATAIAARFGMKAETRVMHFPDEGTNLFNYI